MAGHTNHTTLVSACTPIKRNGSTGSTQRNGHPDKHHSKERECEGANFAQIICKEVKKAFRKQSHKHKKHRTNAQKVTTIVTTVHEFTGRIAQGN